MTFVLGLSFELELELWGIGVLRSCLKFKKREAMKVATKAENTGEFENCCTRQKEASVRK